MNRKKYLVAHVILFTLFVLALIALRYATVFSAPFIILSMLALIVINIVIGRKRATDAGLTSSYDSIRFLPFLGGFFDVFLMFKKTNTLKTNDATDHTKLNTQVYYSGKLALVFLFITGLALAVFGVWVIGLIIKDYSYTDSKLFMIYLPLSFFTGLVLGGLYFIKKSVLGFKTIQIPNSSYIQKPTTATHLPIALLLFALASCIIPMRLADLGLGVIIYFLGLLFNIVITTPILMFSLISTKQSLYTTLNIITNIICTITILLLGLPGIILFLLKYTG